jgi:hypothetical protein
MVTHYSKYQLMEYTHRFHNSTHRLRVMLKDLMFIPFRFVINIIYLTEHDSIFNIAIKPKSAYKPLYAFVGFITIWNQINACSWVTSNGNLYYTSLRHVF